MNRGYFFVLEGGEGSGKTTSSELIKQQLETKYNKQCIITREPGGDKVAEQIRNIIFDNNISAKSEALLFAAARNEHLNNVIIPALEAGKIVICDRFVISSIVYQGIARGLGYDVVLELNNWATDNINVDQTFFYDIKPEAAIKRIMKDEEREFNRFDKESNEFHNKLYAGYVDVTNKMDNIITIDATKSENEVANDVVLKMMEYINNG